MKKKRYLGIISIIVLLGTLTAYSQNIVWQIGNKDQSGKEFRFYKDDYRSYINDTYLYEVGKNHAKDFPYFLPGPGDTWAGGLPGKAVIGFSLAETPSPATKVQLQLLFAETHSKNQSGHPKVQILNIWILKKQLQKICLSHSTFRLINSEKEATHSPSKIYQAVG